MLIFLSIAPIMAELGQKRKSVKFFRLSNQFFTRLPTSRRTASRLEHLTKSHNDPFEMPKATTPVAERQGRRHNPLEADILGGSGILRSGKTAKKTKEEKDQDHFVNSKQSARILQLGRELADEDDDQSKPAGQSRKNAFDVDSRFASEDDRNENTFEDDEAWGEEEEIELEGAEVSPEDLAMFNKFLTADEDPLLKHGWDRKPADGEEQQGGTNLADLILEKIQAFEAGEGNQQDMGGMEDFPEEDLHPKVIEVYAKCAICPIPQSDTT